MPFVPKLPTFNQAITIHRLNALGTWVADLLTVQCQFYLYLRNHFHCFIDEYYTERGAAGTPHYQTQHYNIFLLVSKTVVVRGPLEVRAGTGFFLGARDYFAYNNPNIGLRTYWIDQVEPRWPGFPNEHKLVVATQRGFNP